MEPDEVADADWHGPMLRELAELGMRVARSVAIGVEARALAGDATAADEARSVATLERAARMVRMTAALDKRLKAAVTPTTGAKGLPSLVDEAEAQRLEAVDDAAWIMRNLWILVGRPLVRNTVALTIESETEGPERERLLGDLHERLVDREAALIARGPGQYAGIIAGLLAELGLSGRRLDPAFAPNSARAPAGGPARPGDPAANDAGDPGPPGVRSHLPP